MFLAFDTKKEVLSFYNSKSCSGEYLEYEKCFPWYSLLKTIHKDGLGEIPDQA